MRLALIALLLAFACAAPSSPQVVDRHAPPDPETAASGAQSPAATRPAPSGAATAELLGECTLASDGAGAVDALFAGLHSGTDDSRARDTLELHALEHGWPSIACNAAGPDWMPESRAGRCPTEILDRLAANWDFADGALSSDARVAIAIVLERNGRLDEALALIDRSVEEASITDPEGASGVSTTLSECAARLCERNGRHALALDHAARWEPSWDCGNFLDFLEGQHREFRARNLGALHRCEEAVELARTALDTGNLHPDPDTRLLCTWIDCEIGSGRAITSEAALETLLAAAAGRDELQSEVCRAAARLWTLRRAGRDVQIRHLGELAWLDEEAAFELALGLDDESIVDLTPAFEAVGESLRDRLLANLLARTGHPRVEAALIVSVQSGSVEAAERLDTWRRATERRKLLTRPRR